MISWITDLILQAALPPGETGESIRADLDQELDDLQAEGSRRLQVYWRLWEACKLAIRFGLFHLQEKRRGSLNSYNCQPTGDGFMRSMMQDIRFALHRLRRRAAFSTVTVLTLSLVIGTSTAMFSIVDGVLIRSVPFSDPDELVNVWLTADNLRGAPGRVGRTWDRLPLTLAGYRVWQGGNTSFEGVAVHNAVEGTLTGTGPSERITIGFGSASLLSVLRVRPVLGRWFLPTEEGTGDNNALAVSVISHESWVDRLGSDPDVLGKALILDGVSHTIVGVLPDGFRLRSLGMSAREDMRGVIDVWIPVSAPGAGYGHSLEAIARLRPDVTIDEALTETSRTLSTEYDGVGVRIVPRTVDETHGLEYPLILLLGATGVLLLIGCANVATLALGELHERATELSIRSALGARRARIIRHLLVESLALGFLSSVVGVILAFSSTEVLVALAPPMPRVESVGVNIRVLAFAASGGILAGVLSGILPAFVSAKNAATVISNVTSKAPSHWGGFERWLPCVEITLTVVLLVSGGLLARSLHRLLEVDPGFKPDGLATVQVYLHAASYPRLDDVVVAYDELLSRINAITGVTSSTAISLLPFPGVSNTLRVSAMGTDGGEVVEFSGQRLYAMPGYHKVMGIPLVMGEDLSSTDSEVGGLDMLISENIARRHWPEGSPIGGQVNLFGRRVTIVGIVGDVKRKALGMEADRAFYMSLRDNPTREFSLLARTSGNATLIAGEMREAVRAFGADIPVRQVSTMRALIADSTEQERYRTLLIGIFGALAIFLSGLGIFGVTARSVARRTKEMGVRMSLGADAGRLVRTEVLRAVVTGLSGTVAGLVLAMCVAQLLSGLLFRVDSFDPLTYGVVAGGLTLICVGTSCLAATRITSLDPALILRWE